MMKTTRISIQLTMMLYGMITKHVNMSVAANVSMNNDDVVMSFFFRYMYSTNALPMVPDKLNIPSIDSTMLSSTLPDIVFSYHSV
jgi:hypothetical protein